MTAQCLDLVVTRRSLRPGRARGRDGGPWSTITRRLPLGRSQMRFGLAPPPALGRNLIIASPTGSARRRPANRHPAGLRFVAPLMRLPPMMHSPPARFQRLALRDRKVDKPGFQSESVVLWGMHDIIGDPAKGSVIPQRVGLCPVIILACKVTKDSFSGILWQVALPSWKHACLRQLYNAQKALRVATTVRRRTVPAIRGSEHLSHGDSCSYPFFNSHSRGHRYHRCSVLEGPTRRKVLLKEFRRLRPVMCCECESIDAQFNEFSFEFCAVSNVIEFC